MWWRRNDGEKRSNAGNWVSSRNKRSKCHVRAQVEGTENGTKKAVLENSYRLNLTDLAPDPYFTVRVARFWRTIVHLPLVFSPMISWRSCTSGTRDTSPSTLGGSRATGQAASTGARQPSDWTCTTGLRPADSRTDRRLPRTHPRSQRRLPQWQCISPRG